MMTKEIKMSLFFGGIILLFGVFVIIRKDMAPTSVSSVNANSLEPSFSYELNGQNMIFKHSRLGMQLVFPEGWTLQPGESSANQPVRIGFLNAEASANITDSELQKGMKIEIVELEGFESTTLEVIALKSNNDVPLSQKKIFVVGGVDALRTVHTTFGQSLATYMRVKGRVISIMGFVGSMNTLVNSEKEYMDIVNTLQVL